MDSNLTCHRRQFRDLILLCPPASENEIYKFYGISFTNWAAILLIVLVVLTYRIIKFVKNPNVRTIKDQNIQKSFNLIFLGDTGVGKSTLINAFINYLKYPIFSAAKENKMKYCIPYQFCVQKDGETYENIWVTSHGNVNNSLLLKNENFNKNGESVTQMPQEHILKINNFEFRIIDTPGIKDTRGQIQDKQNLNYIKDFIQTIGKIDAICFVVSPNEKKLAKEFEYSMKNLLSIFDSQPLNNVYFFFTHASVTAEEPRAAASY